MNPRIILSLAVLICVVLSLASLVFITNVIYASNIEIVGPLVHVAYIDEISMTKTIALQPGQKYTVQFGLPPSNEYSNYMIVVKFLKPSPVLQVICRGECTYVKSESGVISEVYSESGNVTIVNAGTSTYVGRIEIMYVYRKLEEYTASSSIVKISLKIPDTTINEVSKQIVKIWIDNTAPYVISDVILPGGKSLEKLMEIGEVPKYVKMEPKRVLIYATQAPKGTYTIVLTYDKSSIMPITFLVKALEYLNKTIAPESVGVISSSEFGIPHGWTLLGYVVAVAAIQPVIVNEKVGGITIEGKLVVPASAESGIINIKAISYLIPSLIKFKYVVGAYIVYGSSFKVVNNMTVPVMIYYIPLVYRPVGKIVTIGNKTIIYALVSESDLVGGIWTTLVVQLPSYAKISKIVTPGGMVYSEVSNSLVPWGTTLRPISISPDRHEAYIAVALEDMREAGLYRIYVNVEPLRMYITDQYGRPINCRVVFQISPETKIVVEPQDSVVIFRIPSLMFKPITAYVMYRGVNVATLILNTIPEKPIHVIVKLYNLTIVVTKFRGAPLSGAEVTLRLIGTNFTTVEKTDSNGVAKFVELPAGIYDVEVKVGSTVVARGQIQLNETRIVKLSTNVVFVLTIGSMTIPVTVLQLASMIVAVAITAVAVVLILRFIGKNRRVEYEIYSESDEELQTQK